MDQELVFRDWGATQIEQKVRRDAMYQFPVLIYNSEFFGDGLDILTKNNQEPP